MTIIKFQNHREISEVVHVFGHYGPAPSVVFRSPELSAGAKAAYAYLCTYVSLKDVKSGKMKARPSKRRMQRELGMSNNTLNKYLKELREFGLIEVKQTRVLRDGRKEYGNNIYTLRSHVDFPLDGATSSLSGREIQKAKKLQSWIRDSWESNSLHASNTMSSNTNAQGGWSLSGGSNSDFSSLSLCTHSERLVDVP